MGVSHPDVAAKYADLERTNEYWEHVARLEFVSGVNRALREQKRTQREVADQLRIRPSAVSRALGGGENLSIRSMVRLARAAGRRLQITVLPEQQAAIQDSLTFDRLLFSAPELGPDGSTFRCSVKGEIQFALPTEPGERARTAQLEDSEIASVAPAA